MVGVVPETIARAKDEKLQALGVELIKIAGGGSALLETAARVADERGGYSVHPHLDPLWTDGYQAIAEEVLQALPDCRSLVFPVGGGGLLMGLTEYLLQHRVPVKCLGCEPYNYPKYARFDHPRSRTIADGLILETPHPKVQERIDQSAMAIGMVEDAEIRTAMRDLYARHALVVEPSSAITIAFAKTCQAELAPPVCLILTGGNIARDDFDRLVADDAE
jgi:threonine dehydratase